MVTNLHILCRNLAKNAIGNDIITKLPRYTQKAGAFRVKENQDDKSRTVNTVC